MIPALYTLFFSSAVSSVIALASDVSAVVGGNICKFFPKGCKTVWSFSFLWFCYVKIGVTNLIFDEGLDNKPFLWLKVYCNFLSVAEQFVSIVLLLLSCGFFSVRAYMGVFTWLPFKLAFDWFKPLDIFWVFWYCILLPWDLLSAMDSLLPLPVVNSSHKSLAVFSIFPYSIFL